MQETTKERVLKRVNFIFAVVAASGVMTLLFQNCGSPTAVQYGNTDQSSFANVQNAAVAILNNKCYSCNNPANASGNVQDITNVDYLIYSRLIVAGEPEISPVITQITTGVMPPAPNTALSGSEIDTLKKWVTGLSASGSTGGTLPPAQTIQATYTDLKAKVFTPLCVTCHMTKNYKLDSYAEVMRTVSAGSAANSLLYQAVTVGRTGGIMPQGSSLTAAQTKAISDWIAAGAPNN